MKLQYAILLVVVAAVAGFFAHPYISPCDTITPPTAPVIKDSGPSKPDTVIINRYVEKEVPVYVTRWKTKETIIIDTIYVTKEVPVFRSFEIFTDEYFSSEIYAWAMCPVDSFSNRVEIDYDRYFYDVYYNKIQKEKKSAKFWSFLTGSAVGLGIGVIAAVLVTN